MSLENRVFNGELEIAIFVVNSKHYFVFDDKENYVVDIASIYQRYLEKKMISIEQYNESIRFYRGGASVFNKDNIFDYFSSLEISPKDVGFMKEFFTDGYSLNNLKYIYDYIETHLVSSNDLIDLNDCFKLKARLPRFYLNLDRNIFMHTDWERDFEAELPSNWVGFASSRFGDWVPDKECYWNIEHMNFWKLYS